MALRTKAKGLARPAAAPALGAVVEELPAAPAPVEPDPPEVPAALEAAIEPVDDAADEPEVAPATAPLEVSVAMLMVVFLLIGTPVPVLAAAPMEPFAAAMADEMVPLSEVSSELSDAGTTTGAMPMAPEVLAGILVVIDEDDDIEEVAPPVRANWPE